MKTLLVLLAFLLWILPHPASAETPLAFTSPTNKALALGTITAGFAGTGTWAYLAWYKNRPVEHFKIRNDGWFKADTYAGGADKLGHAMGSLMLFQGTAGVLESAGFTPTESVGYSALLTGTFFTMIEVKDGFHGGFSPSDLLFDSIGIAWGAAVRRWPRLGEVLSPQLEYFPSEAYRKRSEWTYNISEDYSGETFVLAYHLASLPSPGPLRWVDLTVGYRTTGYMPDPVRANTPKQQTFLAGIGLNLREVNRSFTAHDAPAANSMEAFGRGAADFLTTHVRAPKTTLWAAP